MCPDTRTELGQRWGVAGATSSLRRKFKCQRGSSPKTPSALWRSRGSALVIAVGRLLLLTGQPDLLIWGRGWRLLRLLRIKENNGKNKLSEKRRHLWLTNLTEIFKGKILNNVRIWQWNDTKIILSKLPHEVLLAYIWFWSHLAYYSSHTVLKMLKQFSVLKRIRTLFSHITVLCMSHPMVNHPIDLSALARQLTGDEVWTHS